MKKKRIVYLAGKVRKHCWRHSLVPDLKWGSFREVEQVLPEPDFTVSTIRHDLRTNGPFFVACDHGCSHGEGTHGVGRLNCDVAPWTRSDVYERSIAAIDAADAVFCWIDDEGAYGTCVEIGYARAKDKRVFVAMSKKAPAILSRDLWFLFEGLPIEFYDDVKEAFLDF